MQQFVRIVFQPSTTWQCCDLSSGHWFFHSDTTLWYETVRSKHIVTVLPIHCCTNYSLNKWAQRRIYTSTHNYETMIRINQEGCCAVLLNWTEFYSMLILSPIWISKSATDDCINISQSDDFLCHFTLVSFHFGDVSFNHFLKSMTMSSERVVHNLKP